MTDHVIQTNPVASAAVAADYLLKFYGGHPGI
jgi:hypothetical protein